MSDDVVINLTSVIPGQKTSYYELAINQSVVNANSGIALTGDWAVDRGTFNLASVLEEDGWGHVYEEQMSTRTILSAGPDADYFTPDDNIPPGVVPDDTAPSSAIQYVDGSGQVSDTKCTKLTFAITNTSGSAVTLTSIKLTWSSPSAWYKKVKLIDDVVEQSKPQVASGVAASFNSGVTLQPGQTETVQVESFRSKEWEGGSKVDMSNVDISVEFSEGSTFTFNTSSC